MSIAWSAKVSPAFLDRVVQLAGDIGCPPDWLMACMAFETGRTFSPSVRNPASSATGLIQFMDATARGLGTSTAALAAMSAEEQLEWVARYFKGYAGRIDTLASCYMAILWPKAISEPDDAVIFPPGSQAYLVNRGLDLDHDGGVTKAEAASKVAALLEEGYLPQNCIPAPIEDRSVDASPEDSARIRAQEDPAMATGNAPAGFADIVTGVASTAANIFLPGSGALVQGLAGVLINAFSPLAKDKFTKELGRHDIPPEISGQVFEGLINTARQVTGIEDPVQAVAKATANADLLQKIEQSAVERLNQLAPALQQLVELRKADVAIDTASADAAAARADATSVRKAFSTNAWKALAIGAALMGVIAVAQIIYSPDHKADGQIVGALILAFGSLGTWIGMIAHYGFGTTGSSGVKDIALNAAAVRGAK